MTQRAEKAIIVEVNPSSVQTATTGQKSEIPSCFLPDQVDIETLNQIPHRLVNERGMW